MNNIIWRITDTHDAVDIINSYSTAVNNIHILKTINNNIGQVIDGVKRAELRQCDRDYKVGDILVLREWSKNTNKWGLLNTICGVTHIVSADVIKSIFGPKYTNICMLSIQVLESFKLAKVNTEITL